MLYQYNAEDYEKPISFISPSGKSYVKEYDVRNEYNVEFNLSSARIKIVQEKLRKFPIRIKINIRDGGT